MAKKKSNPQAAAAPAPGGKIKASDLAASTPPPLPPTPTAAPTAAPTQAAQPASEGLAEDDKLRIYSRVPGQHPGLAGPVAMNNWIGHVNGVHRTVDRLTPVSKLPREVVAQMRADGMTFATVPAPSTAPPARSKGPRAVKSLGKGGIRIK